MALVQRQFNLNPDFSFRSHSLSSARLNALVHLVWRDTRNILPSCPDVQSIWEILFQYISCDTKSEVLTPFNAFSCSSSLLSFLGRYLESVVFFLYPSQVVNRTSLKGHLHIVQTFLGWRPRWGKKKVLHYFYIDWVYYFLGNAKSLGQSYQVHEDTHRVKHFNTMNPNSEITVYK